MSITIKSGAKVLYQWERGVALTASTPCDILRISREDDRVTDDLYPVISGSTGTALIPDRMLTESGYLHVSRIDHADGSERVLETVRILVRHAAKPQNTASSTKEIDDMQTIRMQMAALERAAREGKFDGKDGTTPHIGENGNWWLGDDDTGIAATGDDGITPHIGGNGNWYIGDTDTGVKATGEDGITPHIGENGNWWLGETDTGVKATGEDGITPHIGENGNWYIGEEDTGVFARNEDVSLYADDMYTSGILEKGAMQLKILEPSGSNVIRYEIESAVVYIKGVRRARGGFTTSTQAVNFERLFANILRLNVEKGTFSWRVAEVTRDGDNLVNIDNGEIYPARSGDYYDLIPYLVHVPAGETAITYDMVEDLRADERYCGYVRDRLAPKNVWYGTCTSSSYNNTKYVVNTDTGDFALVTGNILYVLFKYSSPAGVTLNVDGTGEIQIKAYGTTDLVQGQWGLNEVVGFVYDGEVFRLIDGYLASTSYYGKTKLSSSTSSTATNLAATPSAVKQAYDLATTANTAAGEAKAAIDDLSEAVGGKANGITDTATGEVIALTDSAEAPLSGLVVYGKSTQDGTPTPDAPVPIVSVGEDGEISCRVYGGNLGPSSFYEGNKSMNGITFTDNGDGTITANGTCTTQAHYVVWSKLNLPQGTYAFSFLTTKGSANTFFATANGYSGITSDLGNGGKIIVNKADPQTNFVIIIKEGVTANNLVFRPMLNCGETALPYEPYKPPQTITIQTQNSLCGIPVTSGGNYTDASGQQWVCDEIDFVRGVRVQRVGKVDMSQLGFVTDSQGYWKTSALVGTIKTDSNNPPLLSDKYTASSWSEKSNGNISMNNAGWVVSLNGSTTEPPSGTLHYALTEPIETPLTEEELASYRALQTNYPNTTIYADDNAGLSAGYSADTKHYIDKKFAELAAAIVNN